MISSSDQYIQRQQDSLAFTDRATTNYLPILRLIRSHLLVAKDTEDFSLLDDIIEMVNDELLND